MRRLVQIPLIRAVGAHTELIMVLITIFGLVGILGAHKFIDLLLQLLVINIGIVLFDQIGLFILQIDIILDSPVVVIVLGRFTELFAGDRADGKRFVSGGDHYFVIFG